jgi:hypothetical protein
MMTLLEDLRLMLRQACHAIGLRGDAATAVSLVVLGVALNMMALYAVQYAGIGRHSRHDRATLQSAAHKELHVVRTVVASTLKKIGGDMPRKSTAPQCPLNRDAKWKAGHAPVGYAQPGQASGSCDVIYLGRPSRIITIAPSRC